MRYVLATAAALALAATFVSVAPAASKLRPFIQKATKQTVRGYSRPSGSGHWSTAHGTTSPTNPVKVRHKK